MTQLRSCLAAAALLLLAACTPIASPDSLPPPTASAADCAAAGGSMQPAGALGTPTCIVAYADAGKVCTDGDQCLGDCRVPYGSQAEGAVSGFCQADSNPYGCRTNVENGRIDRSSTLCAD